jgi:hypothetical protein
VLGDDSEIPSDGIVKRLHRRRITEPRSELGQRLSAPPIRDSHSRIGDDAVEK